MARNRDGPTISAVIITKDPRPEHLAWTLDSLADQTRPPDEIIISDASDPPIDASVDGVETHVINNPDLGNGGARREGLNAATGDYIIELDEDAVLLSKTYIEKALDKVQTPDVSAAGGVVYPIRGNSTGKAIAALDRINPSDLGTHYIVYPRHFCVAEDGGSCYPMNGRGEDMTVRERLREFGEIERMGDELALKDLPTTRQEGGLKTLAVGVAGGVVSGLITAALQRRVKSAAGAAYESLSESA